MSPRVRTLAAVCVFAVFTAGCGSGGDMATVENPFGAAASGLCRAATEADRPAVAREVFMGIVHQPLHELADDTATQDRAVAAALLEAKQVVESALDNDDSDLTAALDHLVDATDRALRALDRPGLPCRSNR